MANTTSRRSLFAAATAIAVGSGVTAGAAACVADRLPTDPDVTLKGICAAAVAADDRSNAAYDAVADISARDARYEKGVEASKLHYADCRAGMNFAALLPALTAGGMRAKAALALREIEPDAEEYPLVVSVLAQLAGRI